MRKLRLVLPLIGIVASGCASVQANSKPADRPALIVPPPPPRIIEPTDVPPEPVGDLPSPPGSAVSRPSRPAAPKPPDSKPEVKTEPQPDVSPKPESSKPPEAKADAAQLRTPQTADTSGAARSVRATIDTARGILNTVNFGLLSNERKKAYNDAKLFLQQAEGALKQGNFAFAQGVATKAETLARELAGR